MNTIASIFFSQFSNMINLTLEYIKKVVLYTEFLSPSPLKHQFRNTIPIQLSTRSTLLASPSKFMQSPQNHVLIFSVFNVFQPWPCLEFPGCAQLGWALLWVQVWGQGMVPSSLWCAHGFCVPLIWIPIFVFCLGWRLFTVCCLLEFFII